MKTKRQAEVLRIVSERDIETQEELLEELRSCGIRVTQATISRDIKELNLVKQPAENGAYKYAVTSAKAVQSSLTGRLRSIFKEGVVSFDMAQNIVVVRTMPGLANAAGAALDAMEIEGFVGSLAGDDTVLIIMRDNQTAQKFYGEIQKMLD